MTKKVMWFVLLFAAVAVSTASAQWTFAGVDPTTVQFIAFNQDIPVCHEGPNNPEAFCYYDLLVLGWYADVASSQATGTCRLVTIGGPGGGNPPTNVKPLAGSPWTVFAGTYAWSACPLVVLSTDSWYNGDDENVIASNEVNSDSSAAYPGEGGGTQTLAETAAYSWCGGSVVTPSEAINCDGTQN